MHRARSSSMFGEGPEFGRIDDGWAVVEKIKRRQNQDLLLLLEEEQVKEEERERMKEHCQSEEEVQRLETIFGIERAKANEHIMQVVA